jgi:exosome complex component CSL4
VVAVLQVRYAKSAAAGALMTPISWQEMQCPVSGTTEPRKVCKPE